MNPDSIKSSFFREGTEESADDLRPKFYGWPPFILLPDGFEKNMHAAPLRSGGNWIDCLLWTEKETAADFLQCIKLWKMRMNFLKCLAMCSFIW